MYTGLTGALEAIVLDDNGIPRTKRIAYISGWSIEDKTEIIETAKVGRTYKDTMPGFQSWSASADGAVVFEAGGHQALFKAKYAGEKMVIHFYLNEKTENGNDKSTYFCGTAYIESLSVDLSAEDKGNISIGVRGKGPLDLIVDGIDVRTNTDEAKEYMSLYVSSAGNLMVTVPDNIVGGVYLDKDNNLIVKL